MTSAVTMTSYNKMADQTGCSKQQNSLAFYDKSTEQTRREGDDGTDNSERGGGHVGKTGHKADHTGRSHVIR